MTDVSTRVSLSDGRAEFDILLDPNNANENFLLYHFKHGVCYESEVVQVMLRVIRRGDYCIDVGANVGFFTLLMAKLVGDAGSILAFEPGTNNLPKLKNNLALNNVPQVTLIEQPAWSKNEKIKFWLDADSSGSNAVWDPGKWFANEKSRQHPESYEIEATRVDDHVEREVRLVKIDTEGAEQHILEGMEATLRHRKPSFIIAEFNPFGLKELGCSPTSMRDFMYGFGYDTFLIHPEGGLPSLVPRQTEITYQNGIVVLNVMFSTLDDVSKAWPKAPYP